MFIAIGVIIILVGIGLFFKGLSNQRLAQLIEDTPTSRTSDINSFGLFEIKGTVECDNCTEVPGTFEPCVWYKVVVQELVNTYDRGRRRSHWKTTRNEEYGVTFQVRDAYGAFDVASSGAEVDVPEVPKANEGSLLNFLGITNLLAGQKLSVWALYPGDEVYVLGEVEPYGCKNAIGRGEGTYPFIISTKEESDLLTSKAAGAWGWMLGSAAAIIGGGLWIAINLGR